jgi:GAF domain-containing protein
VPALKVAAELCTELGRVSDLDDLRKLLVRAADALDASGLIIWMGSPAGADLRPVLAHGYSAQTLARMPAVPRSADNAAAAAYRTSALQIVLSRPGASTGAVVAPLLSPDGCIGALTAEINDRGETSDAVQAFAEIFAAQLASLLASSSVPAETAGQDQIAI